MEKFIKIAKEHKSKYREYGPGAAAIGGGLILKKVNSDLTQVQDSMQKWDSALEPERIKASIEPLSFADADNVFEKYIKGGQKVSRQRILGIPSAKFLEYKELGYLLNKDVTKKFESKKTKEHYNMFADKKLPYHELKNHMIEKAVGDKSMNNILSDNSVFTENARRVIFDSKTNPTFESQHKKLIEIGEDKAAIAFKNAILGDANKGHDLIGEARRLSGTKGFNASTPEVYKRIVELKGNPITRHLPAVSKGLYATGAALLGVSVLPKLIEKTSERSKEKDKIIGGASVATGTPLVYAGVKNILNPRRDVAISYGNFGRIGEGHKSPGNAIKQIFEEDDRLKKYNVEILERGPDRVARIPNKKFLAMIDTGLGAELADSNIWADSTRTTHPVNVPNKIMANKKFRYLTDAIPEQGDLGSGTTFYNQRSKDIHLQWGNNQDRSGARKKVNLTSGMSPALDKNVIKDITETYKTDLITELKDYHQHVKNVSVDTAKAADADNIISSLENIRGKKFISVAGSGRGDYVGSRAIELHDKLKEHGLDKEYSIVALRAKDKGDILESKLKERGIPSIGFVDRKLYNRVQGESAINWGTTGTSGLAETLLHKNIQAIPSDWGNSDAFNPREGTIAHKDQKMKGTAFQHPELDRWNKGNIEYGLKQPGVLKANSSDDIVNLLKDKHSMNDYSAKSKARSTFEIDKLTEGRKRLADTFATELGKTEKFIKLKYAVPTLLGAGLVGSGIKNLYDGYNKEYKKAI